MHKAKLQKQLRDNQNSKLKTQYDEIITSTDMVKIRVGMDNIIKSFNSNISAETIIKIQHCFEVYLQKLGLIPSQWTKQDISIISDFLKNRHNLTVDEDKILTLLTSYEELPLTQQPAAISKKVKDIYKFLDIEEKNTSFKQAIKNKAFILAKVRYEDMQLIGEIPQITLQSTALELSLNNQFNTQDFIKMFKALDMNIANLTQDVQVSSRVLSLTITSTIIPYILKVWHNDAREGESLLNFFIKIGLPCQSSDSMNNALYIALVDNHINVDFIRALLSAKVTNVNTIFQADDSIPFVLTPFSIAVGKANFDLITLLLEYGADPYLAANTNRPMMEKEHGKGVKFCLSFDLAINLPSVKKQQEYLTKLDKFIENYFLNKLSAKKEEISKDEVTDVEASAVSSHSRSKEKAADNYASSSKDESSSDVTLTSTPKLLQQYIKFKQDSQLNTDLLPEKALEHKFDALLLSWIQKNDVNDLNSLIALLEESPQLNSYSVTCLIDKNIPNDLANEALAYKPQLLHKFYTLKKNVK